MAWLTAGQFSGLWVYLFGLSGFIKGDYRMLGVALMNGFPAIGGPWYRWSNDDTGRGLHGYVRVTCWKWRVGISYCDG